MTMFVRPNCVRLSPTFITHQQYFISGIANSPVRILRLRPPPPQHSLTAFPLSTFPKALVIFNKKYFIARSRLNPYLYEIFLFYLKQFETPNVLFLILVF